MGEVKELLSSISKEIVKLDLNLEHESIRLDCLLSENSGLQKKRDALIAKLKPIQKGIYCPCIQK